MKTYIVLLIICLFSFSGCLKAQDKTQDNTGDKTQDAAGNVITDTSGDFSVTLVFDTKGDNMGNPRTDIKIRINQGEAILIQRGIGLFSEIEKADYSRYSIPDKAAAACAGFWAGFLHVIYLIKQDSSLIIMDGGQDEGASEITFREVMRLPVR